MKKLSFLPVIMLGGLLLIGYQSCKHEPEDNQGPGPGPDSCDTTGVSYPGTVYPIFQANCISCHSGASPGAGIDLTDYAQVEVIAQNGQLLGAIKHLQGYSPMPKGLAQLDSCKILQIEIWVRDTTFSEPNPNPDPCDPDTVYFSMDVLPILLSSCAISGCHDAVTAEDGVRLDSYAAVMASDVIVPYNPNESELFEKITETEPEDIMPPPPANPLAAAQVALIQKWISQGALDLYCQADCDTVNVTFSGTIWPQIIQKHCFGCHNGPNASGGIHLENHSQIAAAAAIPAGQPGSLWGVITHASGNSPMPKNQAQLSECKIAQVKKWIDDGTPDN
jgi:mono/diheme cytochrome c family protein